MEKPQLSDRLFFAIACYGSALAWVALCVISSRLAPAPLDMTRTDSVLIGLFLTLPIPGALIGLGTGRLYNHRWRGAIIGVASAFCLQVAIIGCYH